MAYSSGTAALILADFQQALMQLIAQPVRERLEVHLRVLLKVAARLEIPVVITSNTEAGPMGPMLPTIAETGAAAFEGRIMRVGPFDPFDDAAFRTAVEATGRRQLFIAGFPSDVVLAPAAASAVALGYEAHAVMDASASPSAEAHEIAGRRIERAGAGLTTALAAALGLARDLATPNGVAAMQVVFEEVLFSPVASV